MPYDPAMCLEKLNAQGLTPACPDLGVPYACAMLPDPNPIHQFCIELPENCSPMLCIFCQNSQTGEGRYFPMSVFFQECNALAKQDPAWQPAPCYCCCACGPGASLIAVPKGAVPGEAIPAGSPVLTASITKQNGGVQLSWSEAKVHFSQGTGSGGQQPAVVSVTYGEQNQKVLCSADQPVLLAGGKFTTGGKLRAGQKLVDRDGQAQEVKEVSSAPAEEGIHHIATGEPWTDSPDGHVLLLGGIVAGDFVMQIKFDSMPDEIKVGP